MTRIQFISTAMVSIAEASLIALGIIIYNEIGGLAPLLSVAAMLLSHAVTMTELYLRGVLDGMKKCIDVLEEKDDA